MYILGNIVQCIMKLLLHNTMADEKVLQECYSEQEKGETA